MSSLLLQARTSHSRDHGKAIVRFIHLYNPLFTLVLTSQRAGERKKRQVYRSEVHGQLPFDTRGMDDPVPTIDFSPTGSTDAVYSLERTDVNGMLHI